MVSLKVYSWVRDAHLYAGMFVAPFVAILAVSVLALDHPSLLPRGPETRRQVTGINLPPGVEALAGRERIERLRPVLRQLGVDGEVSFIQYRPGEGRLIVPVLRPGRDTVVDLRLREGTAAISSRDNGWLSASVFLHKAPGPHLANIRGNWIWMRAWRPFADGTVFLLLLITLTGLWLWYARRGGRGAGLVWLVSGAATFFGLIYALSVRG